MKGYQQRRMMLIKKWRDEWLKEITRTREIDQEFRKRSEGDKVFTCERYFEPEDIEICK